MDSFEINKIIAAVLLIALIVIGIGKISDIAFHVDKPEKSAYKVEIQDDTEISSSKVKKLLKKLIFPHCLALGELNMEKRFLKSVQPVI